MSSCATTEYDNGEPRQVVVCDIVKRNVATHDMVNHSLGQAVMAAHVPSRPSTFDPTPPEIVPELHLQAMLHSRRLVPRKPQCVVSQPNMSSRRPSTDQPPSYRPRVSSARYR